MQRLGLVDGPYREKAQALVQQMDISWGHFLLINSIIEYINVFWFSLSYVLVGTIQRIHKLYKNFLQVGLDKDQVFSWTFWHNISRPKYLGGWGIKDLPCFSKDLVAKCIWKIIKGVGMWNHIIYQKYIAPLYVVEWICVKDKPSLNISNMWKAIIKYFDVIGGWLAQKIGNGKKRWNWTRCTGWMYRIRSFPI